MNTDRRHYLVLLGINHADVRGAGIHDINFVSFGIGGDACGLNPNCKGPDRLKGAQINDSNSVALAIRDVGVLTVERSRCGQAALVEIPPPSGGEQRE